VKPERGRRRGSGEKSEFGTCQFEEGSFARVGDVWRRW